MLKFLKSEFSKNVITLTTGTTIAQAIPLLIAPILTRIYTPEDFGVLAFFSALSFVFGAIANGSYEFAIVLPKKDGDAINLAALSAIISFSFSLFLFMIVLFFHNYIAKLLGNKDLSFWLYFVPLSVIAIAWFNVLNYYNTRLKNFKVIAKANVIKAIALAIIQVPLGFLKVGVIGLVSGQILSFFSGNFKMSSELLKKKRLFSTNRMKKMGKRYINFPKFSVWSTLANTLSLNVSNILISLIYSTQLLGFFSLVNRALGMPSSLIGNSIGQVFFQQASKEKQQTNNTISIFKSTFKKLVLIGIPVFTLIFFFVEDIFAFVFGEEWRIAGYYTKLLTPMFFIRFLSSTLSQILNIFEKQKIALLINIILLITIVSLLFSAKFLKLEFDTLLIFWSAIMSFEYGIFLFIYYKLSHGEKVS